MESQIRIWSSIRLMLVIWTGIISLGCGSSSKVAMDSAALGEFTEFIGRKSFEFRADTAHPTITQAFNAVANAGLLPPGNNASIIQLIDIANYIKVDGDSVSGSLPYYGERQFGGAPLANFGIDFEGEPKAYTQVFNKAKQRYEIDFDIASETGQHSVSMVVFPNKNTEVSITGSQRHLIRYRGKLMAIENKQ